MRDAKCDHSADQAVRERDEPRHHQIADEGREHSEHDPLRVRWLRRAPLPNQKRGDEEQETEQYSRRERHAAISLALRRVAPGTEDADGEENELRKK